MFDRLKGQLARESSKKNARAFGSTPEMAPPLLRLRGGTGGDEEKWLCETCGKLLASKRNLDLHMSSVHVSHQYFDCVMPGDGVLKWKCSLCWNLLSSKQRIISHLVTTHGKTNLLEQGNKQNLDSQTTLWRRKRSADGSFVNEQCSSKSYFQEDSLSNFDSSSIAGEEAPVPDAEGFSSSLTKSFTEENIGDVLNGQKELAEPFETSRQDTASDSNENFNYGQDSESSLGNDTKIFSVDDSLNSDTDSSSSNNDYSSSETEASSSEYSDSEDPEDNLETKPRDSVKEFTEKEKLSVLILSYIAKQIEWLCFC